MVEELLSEIYQNWHFWKGGSIRAQILGRWGCRPQFVYELSDRGWCSYNFASGSFHTKKLCSRLLLTEFKFYWQKQQNCALCHLLGDLGLTYMVHLWLVGANWTFFAGSHGW